MWLDRDRVTTTEAEARKKNLFEAYRPDDITELTLTSSGATARLVRGDLDDAANSLVSAASQTHVAEHDYLSVLRPLAEVLARRNDPRSALTVVWYMAFSENDGWKRAMAMLPGVPAVDRARTQLAATAVDRLPRRIT